MAYWQVRAQLDKSYKNIFLDENRWALLSEEHKNQGSFTKIINSIQEDEILFLVNEHQKINYYGRCSKNELNGVDIKIVQWIKLSSEVNALINGAYMQTITNIKNNDKLDELLQAIRTSKSTYKINKVNITNFRLIENVKIKFDKSINVIIANNGIGKTSILDAISIGYGAMLTRFPKIKGLDFKERDLQKNKENKSKPYMNIKIESKDNIVWDRTTKRDNTKKTAQLIPNSYGLKELNNFVDLIVDNHNEDKNYVMPLVMYYGTCRNCFESPMRKTNFKKDFNRFESLESSLSSSTNFNRLFQWFDAMATIEDKEIKEKRDFDYTNKYLDAVRNAIEIMIPTFTNPRIQSNPLRFMIDKKEQDGTVIELQIEQLSAGYKAVLAMTMDISARMVEANPDLGNNSEAIILIDELDLHLHPTWQQSILLDLNRTFPNAQFIITTHSPHIISSVKNEYIKILKKVDNNIEIIDGSVTFGREIEWVLKEMGLTYSRNPKISEELKRCQNFLNESKYNEAETCINNLERDIGQDDREIMNLRNALFFERD
jgi:predicted ATP-binding protein involved in virulence